MYLREWLVGIFCDTKLVYDNWLFFKSTEIIERIYSIHLEWLWIRLYYITQTWLRVAFGVIFRPRPIGKISTHGPEVSGRDHVYQNNVMLYYSIQPMQIAIISFGHVIVLCFAISGLTFWISHHPKVEDWTWHNIEIIG